MNEGRRALLRVLLRTRVRFVAARCRVTPSAVYNWTSGRNLPSARCRGELARSYHIAAESWNRWRAVHRTPAR